MRDDRGADLYNSDFPLTVSGKDNGNGAWHWCMARIQAAVILGNPTDAAELLIHAENLMKQGTVVTWGFGLTAKFAGIAAATGDDRQTAERHFETALHQAEQLPQHNEQAETRRWYAWALERFDRPGDRERARELRSAAAAKYQELGARQLVELPE